MKKMFLIILIISLTFIFGCATNKTTAREKYENNSCQPILENKLRCTFICPMGYRPESFTQAGEIICKKEKKNEVDPYYFLY